MGQSKTPPVMKSSARLLAVQAVYSLFTDQKSAADLLPDYLAHYAGMEVDGETMVKPDQALFQSILEGVERDCSDLEAVINEASGEGKKLSRDKEPLLLAVLLCGSYELKNHYDIDIAIIISDYVDVAKAFFDQNEDKLVNAVLDKIAQPLRPKKSS